MEPQTKTSAKDFFINLGAIVALYTTVVSLVNLLFRVINTAYPKINESYLGFAWNSGSISWPVAAIIVFFPIFILLMWLLERDYKMFPEKQYAGIHKWLAYITLFVFGLAVAGDLLTVLYYFIDGQELTVGFLLKVLVLLVIAGGIFSYYLLDVRGKLTGKTRKVYRIVAFLIVLGSIIWGFAVLGSPRTQRLYKYDEQKVNDLTMLQSEIASYYATNGELKSALAEMISQNYYIPTADSQTGKPYEYEKLSATTYNLCAEFNKPSQNKDRYNSYIHEAGRDCFTENVNPNDYFEPLPRPMYLK